MIAAVAVGPHVTKVPRVAAPGFSTGASIPSVKNVAHSFDNPTASATDALASARSFVPRNWGIATAPRTPAIAATMTTSIRVKPLDQIVLARLNLWRAANSLREADADVMDLIVLLVFWLDFLDMQPKIP